MLELPSPCPFSYKANEGNIERGRQRDRDRERCRGEIPSLKPSPTKIGK
jgi:hypothetical protein